MKPGDFVLIQFGHNDICPIDDKKERGVIPGTADTCHVYKMEKDGRFEVVYSFGWYLKKMIDDTKEKEQLQFLFHLPHEMNGLEERWSVAMTLMESGIVRL